MDGQDRWRADDRRELHKQWLEAVQQRAVNLTAWEEDFVESLGTQFEAGHTLSIKQAEILERIYAEKTP